MNWQVKKLIEVLPNSLSSAAKVTNIEALMLSLTELDLSIGKAAVVVSRLPLRWDSGDSWLESVRRAVSRVKMDNQLLVTSTGSKGWDYVAWTAGRIGLPRIIVIPSVSATQANQLASQTLTSLDLHPDETCFIAPIIQKGNSHEEKLHCRDRLVVEIADVVYPVVIRTGGFWDELLRNMTNVDSNFRIEYPRRREAAKWRNLSRSTEGDTFQWSDHYVHLTRGAFNPWPGERTSDYFSALTDAKTGNPRDETATLSYILDSGILRGSGAIIREATPVISFSSSNPYDLLRLSTTRARIHGAAYQPFGIAVRKKILQDLGARPVIYGSDSDYQKLVESEKAFFQHRGGLSVTHNLKGWEEEREIRLPGDLDLLSIKEHITVFVPTANIAGYLFGQTGYRTISLFTDDGQPR